MEPSHERLVKFLKHNCQLQEILDKTPSLGMPNWYVASGSIPQTVWNIEHGFEPTYGINDYDLVYFDAEDLSYDGENVYVQKSKELFRDIPTTVEVRNQARVHLWFEKRFGYNIRPYKSTEDSINTWGTTATSTGVTKNDSGDVIVFAPYGLEDMFNVIARYNEKSVFTKELCRKKVDRWIKVWPKLKILGWDGV